MPDKPRRRYLNISPIEHQTFTQNLKMRGNNPYHNLPINHQHLHNPKTCHHNFIGTGNRQYTKTFLTNLLIKFL